VSGRGLFQVIREFYPRWLLWIALVGVLAGHTIGAAANLGGIAAALNIVTPLPIPLLVAIVALLIFVLQVVGSYALIRTVFRWLALSLLAYVGAGILSRPDPGEVLRGTFAPSLAFNEASLTLLVAIIGTALSAYIFTWQSNQEVEEEIAQGRTRLSQRIGATGGELRRSRRDVLLGMTFANLVMYFIILSTASTLHPAGQHEIDTAAQAAEALRPLAGPFASGLFILGIVGVGFLAVPVLTTGAAYNIAQAFGWRHSLAAKAREAVKFYVAIGLVTLVAVGLNFLGINPMRALVWAGVVQGFSAPPLLLLMMLMTNNRRIMGDQTNGLGTNILGWTTTAAVFLATAALVASWLL
jgi:Mn2+/Fe2+ NRAMP family transporter